MGFSQLLQIEIVVFANYRIVAKLNLTWYTLTEGNVIMSLNQQNFRSKFSCRYVV